MTVETNNTLETYVISGNGPYAFSFRIFDETDLTVTALESGEVDPVAFTYGVHYSVTGVNDEDGGSITLLGSTATTYASYTLDIRSNVPREQPTSIKNQGTFAPQVHETAFDRLSRQVQDLYRQVRQSFRYPDNVDLDAKMTDRSSWLERWLYVNADGEIEPAVSVTGQALTQSIIGETLYPRTAAEIAASVTPVNYAIPSHDVTGTVIVNRYGSNTTPLTTNMSATFALAKLVAYEAECPIEMLAEGYLAAVSLRHNNVGIIGAGSAFTTIKQPPGTLTDGGVIEVGDTASGGAGAAYSGFVARGFTIDGNAANTTAPGGDITGHGMILTDITNWDIADVVARDCHLGGIIPVIRSNNGRLNVNVINCGHGGSTWPGFDINSSTDIVGTVRSINCNDGARVLDNCRNINLDIAVRNATVNGFIANNQAVNESHNCQIRVNIEGGCSSNGAIVSTDFRNSIFHFTISGVTGQGVQEVEIATATDRPSGNTYIVNTRNGQNSSCYIGGDGGNWTINSLTDGLNAATVFAVVVDGERNNIALNVTDSAVPVIRGIQFTADSSDNTVLAFTHNTLVENVNDGGTNNKFVTAVNLTAQTLSGSGAVSLLTESTYVVTTGSAAALTLADGVEGQTKFLVMKTDGGGDATLTPTNLKNGTTVTFNDAGDSAALKFLDGEWVFMGGTATLA